MKGYYSTYERAYYDPIGLYIYLAWYDKEKFIEIFTDKITEQTLEDWKFIIMNLDIGLTLFLQIMVKNIF